MRDETGYEQRDDRPVRDVARAQVVHAEKERVEEQPDHWLRIILKLSWGYGEGVVIEKG